MYVHDRKKKRIYNIYKNIRNKYLKQMWGNKAGSNHDKAD